MSDENRNILALGDPNVSQVIMGQSPPSSSYNDSMEGLPFFQGKADFGQLFPKPRKWCSSPGKLAKAGDILISVRAPVGDLNLANTDCCVGRGLAAIRPSANVDRLYLFFCLQTLKGILRSRASGSIFEAINGPTLKDLEIPLPPLDEQRAISTVLWKLQQAIEVETDLIRVSRELKAAVMNQLFTKGLRGEPQKETEIGLVPESWEVTTCESVCTTISVGIVVRPASHYVSDGGVPAFRSLNVREDRLNLNQLVRISAEANDGILSKSKLQAGDVLIVRTGYPGTSCVVPPEMAGSNCIDIVFARPIFGKIRSKYLSRFLNSDAAKSQVLSAKTGLAQQHLNTNAVKAMQLPLPNLDEQDEICSILESIDTCIFCHENKAAALTELYTTLLSKLMSAEIRVTDLNLDLTTPAPSLSLQGAAA